MTALGALGGAALTTLGGIIVEDRKAALQKAARDEERRATDAAGRAAMLEALAKGYQELGEIDRRAAEFAESGSGGTVEDVRKVWLYFSGAVRTFAASRIPPVEVTRTYGSGTIRGWAARFKKLSDGANPQARGFSALERHNFRVLYNALDAIADKAGEAELEAPPDPYGDYMNDSNVAVSEDPQDSYANYMRDSNTAAPPE